ncbi:MAG: hypothetical protein U0W40_00780 [Acidimicrobiia bacterium]
MSRKWVAVTSIVVVVALVVGVVASHALTGSSSTKTALPPVGPTQKLIGPNDGTFGDEQVSSPAPATPAGATPLPNVVGPVLHIGSTSSSGSGSAGGSGAGGSGAGGSGAGGHSTSSTTAGTTGATTGGAGTTGTTGTTSAVATATTSAPLRTDGPISPADPSAPRVLGGVGLVHFTDPCAAAGGASSGVCRGGIGGTILPIDNPIPAFEITSASLGYCDDATGYDVDSLMIVVHSTAPGRFWAHVRGDNNTSLNGNGFRASYDTAATPDAEVARWNASDRTTDVVTCFTVGGQWNDPSHHYTAHVEGLSDPDGLQHGAYDFSFTYERGGRPPVVVTPGSLSTQRVIGVSLPGAPNLVPHMELRASGASTYAPNCPDEVLLGMPEVGGGTDIPTSELHATGYPYSRRYTQRFAVNFTTAKDIYTGEQVPLDVNTKYALCIRWVDPANPSAPTDARPLSIKLESPDLYQIQLRVKSIDLPSEASTFDLTTFGGVCRFHLGRAAGHLQFIDPGYSNTSFASATGGDPAERAAQYPNGRTSCNQPDPMTFADTGGYAIGPDGRYSLEVDTTLNGENADSSIWVPISPCSPAGGPCPWRQSFMEDYTVPIADGRSVTLTVLFLHSALYHGGAPWPVDAPEVNPHYGWTGGGNY